MPQDLFFEYDENGRLVIDDRRPGMARMGLGTKREQDEARRELERQVIGRVMPPPAARQMTDIATQTEEYKNRWQQAQDTSARMSKDATGFSPFNVGPKKQYPEPWMLGETGAIETPPPQVMSPEGESILSKMFGGALGAAQMFGTGGTSGALGIGLKALMGGGLGAFGTENLSDVRGQAAGGAASRLGADVIRKFNKIAPDLAQGFGQFLPRLASAAKEGGATALDLAVSGREMPEIGSIDAADAAAVLGFLSPVGGRFAQMNRKASDQARNGAGQARDEAAAFLTGKRFASEAKGIDPQVEALRDAKVKFELDNLPTVRWSEKRASDLRTAIRENKALLRKYSTKFQTETAKLNAQLNEAIGSRITDVQDSTQHPFIAKQLAEKRAGVTASSTVGGQSGVTTTLSVDKQQNKVPLDQLTKEFSKKKDQFVTRVSKLNAGLRDLQEEFGAEVGAKINLDVELKRFDSEISGLTLRKAKLEDAARRYGEDATELNKKNQELYRSLLDVAADNSTLHRALSKISPVAVSVIDSAVIALGNPYGWKTGTDRSTRILAHFTKHLVHGLKKSDRIGPQDIPRPFEDLAVYFDKMAQRREHEPAARAAASMWRSFVRAHGEEFGLKPEDDDTPMMDTGNPDDFFPDLR